MRRKTKMTLRQKRKLAEEFAALEAAAGAIPLKVKRADLTAARRRSSLSAEHPRSRHHLRHRPAGTGKTYLAVPAPWTPSSVT